MKHLAYRQSIALLAFLCCVPAAQAAKRYHKLIVDAQETLDPSVAGMALLVADYGSFRVLEVPADQIAALSRSTGQSLRLRDDLDRLLLQGGSFDTQQEPERAGIPTNLREAADLAGERLALIQFLGPAQDRWLQAVRDTGARPVQAMPTNGMLVWATPQSLDQLRKLAARREGLQYVGAYHPQYKLSAPLQKRFRAESAKSATEEVLTLSVQRYGKGASGVETLAEEVVVPAWPMQDFENLRIRIREDRIPALLQRPEVVWAGEWTEPEMFDEVQNQILAGQMNPQRTVPTGPGYLGWLLAQGLSDKPDNYPIITITDDGIGDGTLNTGDRTLHVNGNPNLPSRVIANDDCTGDGAFSPDGHGHINTSIAGGYDTRQGNPFQDANGYLLGLGTNPFTRLAGMRIFEEGGGFNISRCGNTNRGVISRTYRQGARISSNSWGAPRGSDYDLDAQEYDAGTRDALAQTAGNQELLFIFSAGNQGPGTRTIGTPGTAKNVITVGASENVRPAGMDGCAVGPTGADNASQIIPFSSRGPAEGERAKPEIIGPGTHIQGTASTAQDYTGEGVCNQFWPAGQQIFAWSSGTSHSAPAISGVVSIYHHWLALRHQRTNPSPAFQKAYLLAHTGYLAGIGGDLPSNNQGYGMPDLNLGLDDAPRVFVDQTHRFDQSGEVWETTLLRENFADRPFKAVLVWTDAPGSLSANPQVNDLDLEVIFEENVYSGNRYQGEWSQPGRLSDTANNTEAVTLPPGEGLVQIRVLARNIIGDGVPTVGDATDQDFALVLYNASNQPTFQLAPKDSAFGVCINGSTQLPIDLTPFQGFNQPVALQVQGMPSGVTAAIDPSSATPPAEVHLNVSVAPNTPFGVHPLVVTGTSGSQVRTQTLQFGVDSRLYAAVQMEPQDQALSVLPNATLSWWVIATASSYQLQVATDAGFGFPVVDAIVSGTSYTTPTLESNRSYFWRVRARNSCGDAPFSPVRTFKTANVVTLSPTCADLPRPLPDNDPTGITCTFQAPNDFLIQNLTLDVDIEHSFSGDLRLTLVNPQGVTLSLKNIDGDDRSDNLIGNYDETLTPAGPGDMSVFENQQSGGTWSLVISDNFVQDVGQVRGATLNFTGFVPELGPPVPLVGWLGGSVATLLAGWLCQRSARRQRRPGLDGRNSGHSTR